MKTTAKTTLCFLALTLLATAACGSSGDDDAASGGAGGSGATGAVGGTDASGGSGADGGATDASGGSGAQGGSSAKGGSGGSSKGGSSGAKGGSSGTGSTSMDPPFVPGEPCDSVDSALPPKPCMVNVAAKVSGNSVDIRFDPIDGAVDYRVYELPADGDVSASGDHLTIKNATYRCAGTRQAPPVPADAEDQYPGGAIKTFVDGQSVYDYTRKEAEATLGYVSPVPGDGLVPVYALGDGGGDADNSCFWMRWKESRVKQYVATDAERSSLLEKSFRDDGIVFYVPAKTGSDTQTVYTTAVSGSQLYFTDGPEADKRMGSTEAFPVFTDAADGLVPLMRVFYQNGCGRSHDELVAGNARFERARHQGDKVPMNVVHWSGLSGSTTLVVEALADGCPTLPGILAAQSVPSTTNEFGTTLAPYLSPDDARALSSSGELYINGQFDAKNQPRPIARSFVKVKPVALPELDWSADFDDPDALGQLTDEPCGNPVNCYKEYRLGSNVGDISFQAMEGDRHVAAPVFGELWLNYADEASDTPGKFRLTAGSKATMADDKFVYATMEVNAFTTARRYPQLIISDQDAPVQHNLENGNTIVIQTFGDWPYVYELEVCDHRTWDVNNQCPAVDLYQYKDSSDKVQGLAPAPEVSEETGVDSNTHIEAWVSSKRAYLYLDGQPYGCVDLPSGAPGAGPVTVTFGDTLYHSGVDSLDRFTYMKNKFQTDTSRHWDNLGFKSGVAAPEWDESRIPCVSGFGD
jgi:hypothetical protein